MARAAWALPWILAAAGCGVRPGATGPDEGRQRTEQASMAETDNKPVVEYRVYGPAYRVVARIQAGEAKIVGYEKYEDGEREVPAEPVQLDEQAAGRLEELVGGIRLGGWQEGGLPEGVRAALVVGTDGVAWAEEDLRREGRPRALRQWAEAHLHLALHAAAMAEERAEQAEEDGGAKSAAEWYRRAVDRLEKWWKPDGPVRDETGTRYRLGLVAEEDGEFARAADRFRQVLLMRRKNYEKKYGL